MLMMYRMSNTSSLTAPIHALSLSEGLMLPFFYTCLNNVLAFLGQENNQL